MHKTSLRYKRKETKDDDELAKVKGTCFPVAMVMASWVGKVSPKYLYWL